jgi:hypothetical protein
MAWDQRRASTSGTWLERRRPMNSASSTVDGSAIPRQATMMWKPKSGRHLRASRDHLTVNPDGDGGQNTTEMRHRP